MNENNVTNNQFIRILWLCEDIRGVFNGRGADTYARGYIQELYNNINGRSRVQIYPVMPDKRLEIDYISYDNNALYSTQLSRDILKKTFEEIIKKSKPDFIQIWGTEVMSRWAMMDACIELKIQHRVCIVVQGICSEIIKNYRAGLPEKIINKVTLRDIIRRDSLRDQENDFLHRAAEETQMLKNTRFVLGRTEWDREIVTRINGNLKYFKCNEMLSDVYYQDERWDKNKCRQHSILIAQGYYPLKGLHYLIEAVAALKLEYEDIFIVVAGPDYLKLSLRRNSIWDSGYSRYIKAQLTHYRLWDNIKVTGMLDSVRMKKEYLDANVLVSCSAIENSSNSVCEGMMLGMPVIATDVGGTKDMLKDNEEGWLYRFGDIDGLTERIKKVFEGREELFITCKKARDRAIIRHNKDNICASVVDAYKEMMRETENG